MTTGDGWIVIDPENCAGSHPLGLDANIVYGSITVVPGFVNKLPRISKRFGAPPTAPIPRPAGNPVTVGKPIEFVTVKDIGVIGPPKQMVDEIVEPGVKSISVFATIVKVPVVTAEIQFNESDVVTVKL